MLICSDDCVIFFCCFNGGLCGFNGGLCGGCVVDDEEEKKYAKTIHNRAPHFKCLNGPSLSTSLILQ